MKNKDAAAIKTLAELGLWPEQELTDEQQHILNKALDPDLQFIEDINNLFTKGENDEID